MTLSEKIEKIKNLILPFLEIQNVDLVDIELKGKSGSQVLRIVVDVDGGISLDRCERISREISDLLDRKDLMAGRYRLEVSSPGLDRPLTTRRDFQRNLGRTLKINYLTELAEIKTTMGTIEQLNDDIVVIKEGTQRCEIDLSKILLAKVIPIW